MAYTSTIRTWYADYFKKGYDLRIVFLGRAEVKAYSEFYDAWQALDQTLTNMGYGTAAIVSTYYPRYIAGTTKWSLHSYSGVAIDIDPYSKGNDFVKGTSWDFSHTKFTREQVLAALAIRTVDGYRVWRWGGDFGDYMHWQLDCPPEELLKGIDWDTVVGEDETPPDQGEGPVAEPNPAFEAAFDEMVEVGIFTEYTDPLDVVTAEKLAAFLTRADDVGYFASDVSELVDQVNGIEASLDDTQGKLRSV